MQKHIGIYTLRSAHRQRQNIDALINTSNNQPLDEAKSLRGAKDSLSRKSHRRLDVKIPLRKYTADTTVIRPWEFRQHFLGQVQALPNSGGSPTQSQAICVTKFK